MSFIYILFAFADKWHHNINYQRDIWFSAESVRKIQSQFHQLLQQFHIENTNQEDRDNKSPLNVV